MCGIGGIIVNNPNGRARGKIAQMAYFLVSELEARGKDATGISAWVESIESDMVVYAHEKHPIRSSHFIKKAKILSNLILKNNNFGFIAHSRAATSGSAKENKNNHPFVGDRFSIIHNGVIRNYWGVAVREDISLETFTDSEIIMRLAEQRKYSSAVDACNRVLDEAGTTGYMAVAMLDMFERKILIFRDRTAPCVFARINLGDDINVLMFASTRAIIRRALKHVVSDSQYKMWEALPYCLYSIDSKSDVKQDELSDDSMYSGSHIGYGVAGYLGGGWGQDRAIQTAFGHDESDESDSDNATGTKYVIDDSKDVPAPDTTYCIVCEQADCPYNNIADCMSEQIKMLTSMEMAEFRDILDMSPLQKSAVFNNTNIEELSITERLALAHWIGVSTYKMVYNENHGFIRISKTQSDGKPKLESV